MKDWKKIFHANGDQKIAGVAILISDKIDFENKGCENRHRRTLYNDQRINPRRRYNNYIYTHTHTHTHKSTVIEAVESKSGVFEICLRM